jgi:hypothetical protein
MQRREETQRATRLVLAGELLPNCELADDLLSLLLVVD